VKYIHLSQNGGRSRTPLYGNSMQSLSLELNNSKDAGIFGMSRRDRGHSGGGAHEDARFPG